VRDPSAMCPVPPTTPLAPFAPAAPRDARGGRARGPARQRRDGPPAREPGVAARCSAGAVDDGVGWAHSAPRAPDLRASARLQDEAAATQRALTAALEDAKNGRLRRHRGRTEPRSRGRRGAGRARAEEMAAALQRKAAEEAAQAARVAEAELRRAEAGAAEAWGARLRAKEAERMDVEAMAEARVCVPILLRPPRRPARSP